MSPHTACTRRYPTPTPDSGSAGHTTTPVPGSATAAATAAAGPTSPRKLAHGSGQNPSFSHLHSRPTLLTAEPHQTRTIVGIASRDPQTSSDDDDDSSSPDSKGKHCFLTTSKRLSPGSSSSEGKRAGSDGNRSLPDTAGFYEDPDADNGTEDEESEDSGWRAAGRSDSMLGETLTRTLSQQRAVYAGGSDSLEVDAGADVDLAGMAEEIAALREEAKLKSSVMAGLRGELRKYTELADRLGKQVRRWECGCDLSVRGSGFTLG